MKNPSGKRGVTPLIARLSLIVPVSGLALAPWRLTRLPGGQRASSLAPLSITMEEYQDAGECQLS